MRETGPLVEPRTLTVAARLRMTATYGEHCCVRSITKAQSVSDLGQLDLRGLLAAKTTLIVLNKDASPTRRDNLTVGLRRRPSLGVPCHLYGPLRTL
jgi:hypothetical protein